MIDRGMAAEFFSEREITPPSAKVLFAALRKTGGLRSAMPAWAQRSALPGKPQEQLHYYYRGQADGRWGLSSTLFRVIADISSEVTESVLAAAESAVLKEMRAQGLGKWMTDGELLMVLQHHAIPTRLIDFCRSQLAALYFATQSYDSVDGRLFVVGQRMDSNRVYPQISLADSQHLPWHGAAIGERYSTRSWTDTVAVVSDPALDPRMRAQRGCFLVGGLMRRYEGENLSVGNRFVQAEEWPTLSTLRIFFPQLGAKKPTSKRWPAVGWTVRIPAGWKAELRSLLAKRSYTTDHMFPDFDGCRRLGQHVARQVATSRARSRRMARR